MPTNRQRTIAEQRNRCLGARRRPASRVHVTATATNAAVTGAAWYTAEAIHACKHVRPREHRTG
jgi:hypothetical protein